MRKMPRSFPTTGFPKRWSSTTNKSWTTTSSFVARANDLGPEKTQVGVAIASAIHQSQPRRLRAFTTVLQHDHSLAQGANSLKHPRCIHRVGWIYKCEVEGPRLWQTAGYNAPTHSNCIRDPKPLHQIGALPDHSRIAFKHYGPGCPTRDRLDGQNA